MTPASVLQSALDPAGPQAMHIARLWWLMFWVTTAVFVLVIAFLIAALVRGRRLRLTVRTTDESASAPALMRAVSAAVLVTVVTLFVLLVASVQTGRAIGSSPSPGGPSPGAPLYNAVTINVTGHQFWWEIEYEDASPDKRVTTANEIHIPVGRPVILKVTSRDVIHSFWAPNLTGKRDLIPGYTTALWLQADRPAIFRGQCAEFCGKQHAHMAFEIVAEPDAAFTAWLDAQRLPAAEPQSASAIQGRQVFENGKCILCHRVRGTAAQGLVGPDLTHVGSRGKIAAATVPNTSGHLAGWVVDAQQIKPGSQMPPNRLGADDLQALLAYLESLK